MKNIVVIGTGYVGLVTGTCFAELGNSVICVDADRSKVERLRAGEMPFYEPGLLELVLRNQHSGRLSFSDSTASAMKEAECIFIAVGTPMDDDGSADLAYVRQAARDIADSLAGPAIVINKSTVPVETGDLVATIIREHRNIDVDVSVVSNPEFLREGSAIADFMKPDRIVLGVSDESAAEFMRELYAPLDAPLVITDVRTAEMIKYTANAFLATKISFINEIAKLCHEVGADVRDVVIGAGSDKRIGTAFMQPGLGFGGSCFPKDVNALVRIAQDHGVQPSILPAVLRVNRDQITWVMDQLEALIGGFAGKRIGVLGLAFKPNTDDVRESPSLTLASLLIDAGATVVGHDPVASQNAKTALPALEITEGSYEATNDADAVIVATDWNEYKQIDLGIMRKLMRGRVLVDARNIYDPGRVVGCGLDYLGVGRRPREQRGVDPLASTTAR